VNHSPAVTFAGQTSPVKWTAVREDTSEVKLEHVPQAGNAAPGVTETVAFPCPELSVAVTTAICGLVITAAGAVKEPPPAPAGIVTEAGTVRAVLLLASVTTVSNWTTLDSIILQFADAPDCSGFGVHCRVSTTGCESKVRLAACAIPLSVAVTAPPCELVTLPVVTVKVALADPAATVTDPGTTSSGVLEVSDTGTPPAASATFDNIIAQVVWAPDPKIFGLQVKELTMVCGTSDMPID
jgi:hypothetical protein